ncbi:inactive poly [ADP-ribose] polymerase RCD1 [Benincasa hispida]|uniref:inactive poly [ADP-ribose] polymerase RCD1 n=1 Tax=Benincasa hispida TaxID=102211 RepID=UPI001901A70E|nr:inactive poly [ADP-ribose] polymerase RCD1 [Benincasa hispida]XP_038887802.1 inactive poly [ADP-ribose] polymerase RCD1 [Benincasa hispida]
MNMETELTKVLHNGQKIVVGLKRKRENQGTAHAGAGYKAFLSKLTSSRNRHAKSKRLDDCEVSCGPNSRRSFLRNYKNFSRSGLPQRFLYYEDGDWVDYPQITVKLIREQFQIKNAAIEVEFNGRHLLLDALYMIQVELKTAIQQHIAWIDDNGRCFFPEFYSGDNVMHQFHQYGLEDASAVGLSDHEGMREINLHLEIGLTEANISQSEEYIEESNRDTKISNIKTKTYDNGGDWEGSETRSQKPAAETQEAVGGIKEIDCYTTSQIESIHSTVNSDDVKNMFLMSMESIKNVEILEVKRWSSPLMQDRLDLFQKQIEITKKSRGNANVQYGWLALNKDVLSGRMPYGVGHSGPKLASSYSVHLSPSSCANLSASYCDDDEKGVRYIAFCHVILGNVEVVAPGCEPYHPSSVNFDSGVDDLHNPSQYLVWNVNMKSHIFPEYVVSFKISSSPLERGLQDQLQINCSSIESEEDCVSSPAPEKRCSEKVDHGSSSLKIPKSPWMPFSMLFNAISEDVSVNQMKLVYGNYGLFREKKISRDEFIRRLRSIVGDRLLRSTLMSLQCKLPAKSPCTFKVPKEKEC